MRISLILLTFIMVSACATAPSSIQYYLLDNAVEDTAAARVPLSDKKVVLTKLELATYLQNPNLPLLQHEHGVLFANQSAWAEPLQQGIKRALVNDFNRISNYQLVLDTMPNSQQSDYQLQITIDHFAATDTSEVILVGNYWLSKGKMVISEHAFSMKQTLEHDGFAHSVSQQRQLLTQLAQQIASDSALNNVN